MTMVNDSTIEQVSQLMRTQLENKPSPPTMWASSSFPIEEYQPLPIATKGMYGAEIISTLFEGMGVKVSPGVRKQYDRKFDNLKVELKFATKSATGNYTFNQIRDQDYDCVILFGVSPKETHCWVVPKDIMWKLTKGQHGGDSVKAKANTHIFTVNCAKLHPWLKAVGGTLEEAFAVFTKVSNGQVPIIVDESVRVIPNCSVCGTIHNGEC